MKETRKQEQGKKEKGKKSSITRGNNKGNEKAGARKERSDESLTVPAFFSLHPFTHSPFFCYPPLLFSSSSTSSCEKENQRTTPRNCNERALKTWKKERKKEWKLQNSYISTFFLSLFCLHSPILASLPLCIHFLLLEVRKIANRTREKEKETQSIEREKPGSAEGVNTQ